MDGLCQELPALPCSCGRCFIRKVDSTANMAAKGVESGGERMMICDIGQM